MRLLNEVIEGDYLQVMKALPSSTRILQCPICRKEFTRYISQIKRVKYTNVCSLDCLYKGRSLGIIKREVKKPYNSSPKTRFKKECLVCGELFETVPAKVKEGRGKYCSRKCFEFAHKLNMRGKKNPSWIDGRSYDRRCFRGLNWDEIRLKIYERDNHTCKICNVKCIGRRDLTINNSLRLIQCHHIEKFESVKDNFLDNLVTVCVSCHTSLHMNSREVRLNE